MSLSKTYQTIERFIKKTSMWYNVLIILALLCIVIKAYTCYFAHNNIEGFINQEEKFTVKRGVKSYDDFYANIYDQLFYKKVTNDYEVGNIISITKPSDVSKMLQLGSKTGHVVNEFHKDDYTITGLEESSAMINLAKNNYPGAAFIQGTPMTSNIFTPESFTHIMCLNLTFYNYKDKRQLLENVYNWLLPGGYFIVQLVNKDMFDPVVPAAKPFYMINPQSFADERITESVVKFNDFDYRSNFEIFPNDFAEFKEIFKDTKTGKVRQNEHKLWMPTIKKITNMAKELGFILHSQVDLLMCQDEYQYLYVFQKPE